MELTQKEQKEQDNIRRRIASKKYYQKNKEYVNQRIKRYRDAFGIINCPCGGKYNAYQHFKKVHMVSIRHENYIKELEIPITLPTKVI